MDADSHFRDRLHRVIIEATNHCNLNCSICPRQFTSGELGAISEDVFSRLLAGLKEIHPTPRVLIGGFGEPLSHPEIVKMVRELHDAGCWTALITNGTLLTEDFAGSLVEAKLDKLWISADSYHQRAIGSSSSLSPLAGPIQQLTAIKGSGNGLLEKLDPGISMVLDKENQDQLRESIVQALNLGVKSFFITNLESYSPLTINQLPYTTALLRQPGAWQESQTDLIQWIEGITIRDPGVRFDGVLTQPPEKCPFMERGDLVLRWDGEVSPCLPLLYDRTTFISSWEHQQYAYSMGNLMDRSLAEIWSDSGFSRLRNRLRNDAFSPCLGCRDCWLSDDNLQDCMGFEHPTCGGCLWAAGLISCP